MVLVLKPAIPWSLARPATVKVRFVNPRELFLEIFPAGSRDGEMIRMTGYGEAVWKGTAGDLYIKINVTPHPVFKRDSNDLVMNLNLKLSEALLGAEYPIQTLDGEIQVTI